MKLCIAGSRHFDEKTADILVSYACSNLNFHGPESTDTWAQDVQHTEITEVISGRARGIDLAGERWACCQWIPVFPFEADWSVGANAGRIRNRIMAKYADCLLLLWDGKSPGSANMREEVRDLGKPVYEVILKGPSLLAPEVLKYP